MIFKRIRESDFKEEEAFIPADQFHLAREIYNFLRNKDEFNERVTKMMPSEDGSLIFAINLGDKEDRVSYELGEDMYVIEVKKLNLSNKV